VYTIISMLSTCSGISILEVLLPAEACLIVTIFAWRRLRLLCLRFALRAKRRELFLLLK
jgi:hypothetical protein